MAAEKKSGSPKGESIYLAIGFLRRPHGVIGEMIMDLHTDFPERIKTGRKVYLGDKYEAATIGGVRTHGNGLLIKIRGCDTPESIGRYRNHWVYVKSSEAPQLPQGELRRRAWMALAQLAEQRGDADGATQAWQQAAQALGGP